MFMTNSNDKSGELLGQERRRRWSHEQKLAMVRESLEPGNSVSVVARRNGVSLQVAGDGITMDPVSRIVEQQVEAAMLGLHRFE